MYFYGMDYSYLVFVMPAVLLSFLAQFFVKSSFSRFSKIKSVRNMTGAQAAQLLLRKNNISDVKIAHISGSLTDNYNSSTKILSLSDSTYASTSIAAIGVAAHETGHAIQHATGWLFRDGASAGCSSSISRSFSTYHRYRTFDVCGCCSFLYRYPPRGIRRLVAGNKNPERRKYS